MRVSLRSIAVLSCVLLVLAASIRAANTSKPQADAFARKLVLIQQHAEVSPASPRRTTVSESELNSWLVFHAPPLLPAGVKNPKVTALGNGKLFGTVIVDLEAVGKQRSTGSTFDAWRYLGGEVPVSLSGLLQTQEGSGRFTLERAEILGVPVPRSLLQEIVSYYTRTADHPGGVRLHEPFTLPASIKQIQVGQGQAVVVQ